MKTMLAFLILPLAITTAAYAQVLPASAADAVCHQKALRAAHFLSESSRPFLINYQAGRQAEISTMITYYYSYKASKMLETLYTVVAYAYPDDGSCMIGSVTNNTAGND